MPVRRGQVLNTRYGSIATNAVLGRNGIQTSFKFLWMPTADMLDNTSLHVQESV